MILINKEQIGHIEIDYQNNSIHISLNHEFIEIGQENGVYVINKQFSDRDDLNQYLKEVNNTSSFLRIK